MLSPDSNDGDTRPEDWTTVYINKQTIFEIVEIIGTGIRDEDINRSEGIFADLYLDDSIRIIGEVTEDGIVAEKIEINVFR